MKPTPPLLGACLTGLVLAGCAGAPATPRSTPTPTGFISDYSMLEKVEDNWLLYIGPELASYNAFIIDPVRILGAGDLDAETRSELVAYMGVALAEAVLESSFEVATERGPGVARVRYAISSVDRAEWYLDPHPAADRAAGGAAMEGEVIDSMTGEQLAAVIRARPDSRLELGAFSSLDDARDAIDAWAGAAAEQLRTLRDGRPTVR